MTDGLKERHRKALIDIIALRNQIETQGVEWYRRRDTDAGEQPDRDAGAG